MQTTSPAFLSVAQRLLLDNLLQGALDPDGPYAHWLHARKARSPRTGVLLRTSAGHVCRLLLRCRTVNEVHAALVHYSAERRDQLRTAWEELRVYAGTRAEAVDLPALPAGGVQPPPEVLLAIVVLHDALHGNIRRLASLTWGEVDLRGRISEGPGSTVALPLPDAQTERIAEALARLRVWGVPASQEDPVIPAIPARRLFRGAKEIRELVRQSQELRDRHTRSSRLRPEGPVDTLLDRPGETQARRLKARETISLRAVALLAAGRQAEFAALPTPEEVADYMAAHDGEPPPSLSDSVGAPVGSLLGGGAPAEPAEPAEPADARARYEWNLSQAILDVEPLPDLDWTGILEPDPEESADA